MKPIRTSPWTAPRPLAVAFVLALLAGACATVAAPPRFVALAEGRTAEPGRPGLDAAHRMFSAPDDVCRAVPEVARLRAAAPVAPTAGEPWSLSEVRADALGPSGGPVPRVPVAVEIDERGSPPFDRERFETTGEVVFGSPGVVTLRLRTLCPPAEREATVRLRVGRGSL